MNRLLLNAVDVATLGFAMRRLAVSADEMGHALMAAHRSMDSLSRQLERAIASDIARLNDTQRAIYFAHRRAGRDHYAIMELL